MATVDKVSSADSGGGYSFIYDERVRNVFYQVVTFVIVAFLAWYLFSNTSHNLAVRGMNSGFGFITATAGFNTDFKLIDYSAGDTYGRIYVVGILNTLFVSAIAIIGATILGFFMGVARLSTNWMVSRMAAAYVEILRNTPLLFQIIFWYLGVFLSAATAEAERRYRWPGDFLHQQSRALRPVADSGRSVLADHPRVDRRHRRHGLLS